MHMAKADFSQMCRSRSDMIENAEVLLGLIKINLDFKKNATNIMRKQT